MLLGGFADIGRIAMRGYERMRVCRWPKSSYDQRRDAQDSCSVWGVTERP